MSAMQWFKDFQNSAATTLARFNNATFKNAAMATCALIATADGQATADEKSKVAALIQKNEMLQVFGATELRDLFLEYVAKAGDEFERIDVMNVVGKIKGNDEQCHTCLKVALIIASADGNVDPKESRAIAEICGRLGVPAADYAPVPSSAA